MPLRLSITRAAMVACVAGSAACAGGGNEQGAANNQAAAAPAVAAAQNQWVRVGVGGCEGDDVGRSDGAVPVAAMCSRAWTTALCWDGDTHRNGPAAWCTYKSTPASQCTGGPTRGVLYTCDPGMARPGG